jgi:cytochrome c oxidase subunit 2
MHERGHIRRALIIWAVGSVIAVLLIIFALGPHMPPGSATEEAKSQRFTNVLLAAVMAPLALAMIVAFLYAIITFRNRDGSLGDGPADFGDSRLQLGWLILTSSVVLLLAGLGTYALYEEPANAAGVGAGGGQGPAPIQRTSLNRLVVQVIGQQWQFTYRFPQYGGVETFRLELPVNRPVEFHVTSLDVVHAFWAYQLGVKADAVPGADNIAFATPRHLGSFDVRCAELCGVWHGEMSDKGLIVAPSAFTSWITSQRRANAPATGNLPPYARSYFPDPPGRAG